MASELGVQTIQHTNGTDALTIGSDGFVSMPNSGVADLYYLQSNVTADGDISDWARTLNGVETTPLTGGYVGSGVTHSSGVFTFPKTGVYLVIISAKITVTTNDNVVVYVRSSNDGGSTWSTYGVARASFYGGGSSDGQCISSGQGMINVTNTSNDKLKVSAVSITSGSSVDGLANYPTTSISFLRIGDSV